MYLQCSTQYTLCSVECSVFTNTFHILHVRTFRGHSEHAVRITNGANSVYGSYYPYTSIYIHNPYITIYNTFNTIYQSEKSQNERASAEAGRKKMRKGVSAKDTESFYNHEL